jgi:Tol biopolymer transport system component
LKSSLEICTPASGKTEVVLETDRLIEAPNWSPDGRFLVVNGDGRLYRVELNGRPQLAEIDTGFASRCNNDHGISPDGKMLVISDQTESGDSCIYTLKIEGGEPRRVTRNRPCTGTAGPPTAGRWPTAPREVETGTSTRSASTAATRPV